VLVFTGIVVAVVILCAVAIVVCCLCQRKQTHGKNLPVYVYNDLYVDNDYFKEVYITSVYL